MQASVAYPHHVDADPDPACHFDADPDPDASFQIKAQTLGKVLIVSYYIRFGLSSVY